MGMMIDGAWSTTGYATDGDGRFRRDETTFHDWIRADGSSPHPAAAGRYHLYVSWACPWAHRTLIVRKLKGLERAIGVSVVDSFMGEDGWRFTDDHPDGLFGASFLREVYAKARADYTGRVTVPVLWDRELGTIVNNESREIMRMLDVELDSVAESKTGFYPEALRTRIDETIGAIYAPINNGVYRAGFARTQRAYDEAVTTLFEALDQWDAVLSRQRYLCGNVVTEADWCLFTTLLRFDVVYHTHFKCNVRRIADYPNLSGYLRDLYQVPGVAQTCNFDHIRAHYYRSHETINPSRIVARGPDLELLAPHGRVR